MMKDKLPDVGSPYETPESGIQDAFSFILDNFLESMKLWCRLSSGGPARDKPRREKERQELSALVATNLVRLSQLDGLTWEFYRDFALPKLIEQLLSTKDAMAQQYLLDCIIQVFPDEYHLNTLEKLLSACLRVQPGVDLKQVVVTLMNRLAKYVGGLSGETEEEGGITDLEKAIGDVDVFGLFRLHLAQMVDRPEAQEDVPSLLEIQLAFLSFTLKLYPEKLDHVDVILNGTVNLLLRHLGYGQDGSSQKLTGAGVETVVEILAQPVQSPLGLQVLVLEHYPNVLQLLQHSARKEVALQIAQIVLDRNLILKTEEDVKRLFRFLAPLLVDDSESVVPIGQQQAALSPEELTEFLQEQETVCQLVHQIQNKNSDKMFQLFVLVRSFFGPGGPTRMSVTLPTLLYKVLDLVPHVRKRELQVQNGEIEEGGEPISPPETSAKKYFLFVHKTLSSVLNANAPDVAIQLWLKAASVANSIDFGSGAFSDICSEFLDQALSVYEEDVTEARAQYRAINLMVAVVSEMSCLDESSYDALAAKLTQHSIKLLKKPQQCKAVNICSHLFWNRTKQSSGKVQECLQKCLKLAEQCVSANPAQSVLFVEILDSYIYYLEMGCPEIRVAALNTLIQICREHIGELISSQQMTPDGGGAVAEAAETISAYFRQVITYLASKANDPRFAELDRSLLQGR